MVRVSVCGDGCACCAGAVRAPPTASPFCTVAAAVTHRLRRAAHSGALRSGCSFAVLREPSTREQARLPPRNRAAYAHAARHNAPGGGVKAARPGRAREAGCAASAHRRGACGDGARRGRGDAARRAARRRAQRQHAARREARGHRRTQAGNGEGGGRAGEERALLAQAGRASSNWQNLPAAAPQPVAEEACRSLRLACG